MGKKLTSNVHVMINPETGEQKWYGPDYPQNGEPPHGAVTHEAAFAEETGGVDLAFTESDFLAAGIVDGVDGDGVDAGGMIGRSLREGEGEVTTPAEPATGRRASKRSSDEQAAPAGD